MWGIFEDTSLLLRDYGLSDFFEKCCDRDHVAFGGDVSFDLLEDE